MRRSVVAGALLLLLVGSVQPAPVPEAAAWDGTWVVAHRGTEDGDGARENTLPALRLAATRGADAAEIDVSLTEDGVPVLLHDLWLERTTDGEGGIFETSWAELSRLRSGGVRVPRLSEALEEAGRLGLPLWLDPHGLPERREALLDAIVDEVHAAGAEDRVWLMSTPCPEGLRCTGKGTGDLDAGVDVVTMRTAAATPDVLERAHAAGVRVVVYWFREDGPVPPGIDGVLTDDVTVARALVDRLE